MTSEEQNRRADDRLPVLWHGTIITVDDRSVPCRVLDVSLAGTYIECALAVRLGEELILNIPELGEFAGEVQWMRNGSFGLALAAGPDLLLKKIAEDGETYPGLAGLRDEQDDPAP
ncbi:hypothetical protein JCM17844_17280 [Iodidimonas gelatinilytica]|uniref:PilZ domain-containing protein n=1 Tax=Iodidimonas gelatinilytica TaxID=1236966 RepID=A0A5A7MVC9_9PROT|nr:PilZ domain-containing protein [Iodidimonas gelatinilytica]GEQ98091.1 hypothetical protein JCM17844_17280 [Iodidimonas gelatinilytica]GEQ99786.1 hypothetical protein JCM17845_04100 [Iodidimonas gelatinilytica]